MGRSKHCSEEEKKIIKQLHKDGNSQRKIAHILGRSQNMVKNALQPPKLKLKRGRQRKTTKKDDDRIKVLSTRNPFMSAVQVRNELELPVSEWTVRRRLCEKYLFGRSAQKVPMLNNRQRKKRIDFAKKHVDWIGPEGEKKWRNVLWSDESKINLVGPDGRTWVRRPKNKAYDPKYTTKTIKHGGGNIMIWGCFSWYGVGPIYWIKENMDRHLYLHILNDVMLPFAEWNLPLKWQYQQDNDPKHTSKIVKEWFRKENVGLMEWPSQSPDLNPIENLWRIVKDKIAPLKAKNKEELWKIVEEAWYSIPLETVKKLVESMPRRCLAVMENKGFSTKY